MQISSNGFGSFTFLTKPGQTDVSLVTNPYSFNKFKGASASLVLQSHDEDDADNLAAISPEHTEDGKDPFVITHAGEYEVQGVFVTGIEANKKNGVPHTIYRIDVEGLHIGYLGALDRVLTEQEIERLGQIDILIVPAGGHKVLNGSLAAQVVAQIEPRIVIASYVDGVLEYGTLDALKRELSCQTEEVSKFKVTRSQLPEEDMKLVTFIS